ncbi:hypothetical protein J4G33_13620 [Actinotalea sp. BY-33]|uniref:histidine kinase n=1 Tax=Actinotalea soli TaxID=2819234 RepID=A0A939LQH2_9CELL|nr:histidine kinase [Actinotalea soli]MBO1752847.1 hypothetical protein [Actinotalea soli]
MSDRGKTWTRVVVAAHLVLGPASVLVVVALAQIGSSASVVALVAVAATGLHVALACARRRIGPAMLLASTSMAVLALVPMPGWSTGVLMPSAVCFLLVSWRATLVAPDPWPRAVLVVGIGGVVLAEGVAAVRMDDSAPAGLQLVEAGLLLAVVVGTWSAAQRTRIRRERAEELERDRLVAARLAERASIRRDLHDVIGHSLALMVAQAEAARVGARDDAVRDSIGQVAETGRHALAGLRAMLRVLDAEPSGTALVPSLEGLPALVRAAVTPLHDVTLRVEGAPVVLAPDAEVALVRVAQEGISNALRHLEVPLAVEVRLTWSATGATLAVHDDGGAGVRAAGDAGSGLIGLAERVAAAGGQLEIDRDRDGWLVRATVPSLADGPREAVT